MARKKTRQSQPVTRERKNDKITWDEDPASSRVEEPEAIYGRAMSVGKALFTGLFGRKDIFPIRNEVDYIDVIRQGIPKKAIDKLMEITNLTTAEMALIMRLSDRTLRRYKPQTLLNPEQSERVVELTRLYSRGEEAFGNLESFKEWMNSTVMALGNKKPKEFLDTSLGIDILMNELGRIEHGIFA
jgi:putative toxin-antitoxin system antitoxin component (TIGR02293 family)